MTGKMLLGSWDNGKLNKTYKERQHTAATTGWHCISMIISIIIISRAKTHWQRRIRVNRDAEAAFAWNVGNSAAFAIRERFFHRFFGKNQDGVRVRLWLQFQLHRHLTTTEVHPHGPTTLNDVTREGERSLTSRLLLKDVFTNRFPWLTSWKEGKKGGGRKGGTMNEAAVPRGEKGNGRTSHRFPPTSSTTKQM